MQPQRNLLGFFRKPPVAESEAARPAAELPVTEPDEPVIEPAVSETPVVEPADDEEDPLDAADWPDA